MAITALCYDVLAQCDVLLLKYRKVLHSFWPPVLVTITTATCLQIDSLTCVLVQRVQMLCLLQGPVADLRRGEPQAMESALRLCLPSSPWKKALCYCLPCVACI